MISLNSMSTGRRTIIMPFIAWLSFIYSFDIPHEINRTNFDEFSSICSRPSELLVKFWILQSWIGHPSSYNHYMSKGDGRDQSSLKKYQFERYGWRKGSTNSFYWLLMCLHLYCLEPERKQKHRRQFHPNCNCWGGHIIMRGKYNRNKNEMGIIHTHTSP